MGVEEEQFIQLPFVLQQVNLSNDIYKRWWGLDVSLFLFLVNFIRIHIDGTVLGEGVLVAKWCNSVPRKVNFYHVANFVRPVTY